MLHTQYQLATTLKKGSETITKYYNTTQALAASLGVAGKVLSPSKFSVDILARLGSGYDSLATSLSTWPEPIHPHQIYTYLLTHESWLNDQTKSLPSSNSLQANLTTTKQYQSFRPSQCGRCGQFPHRGMEMVVETKCFSLTELIHVLFVEYATNIAI